MSSYVDHLGIKRYVPSRRERLRLGISRGRAQDLALRAFVFVRDDFTCQVCRRRVADPPVPYDGRGSFFVAPRGTGGLMGDVLHVDHIWPWSAGGSHEPENLRACCGSCNSKKGVRE